MGCAAHPTKALRAASITGKAASATPLFTDKIAAMFALAVKPKYVVGSRISVEVGCFAADERASGPRHEMG